MKITVNTIPEALSKVYKKYASKTAMYLSNGNKISYNDMMWDVSLTCNVLKDNGIKKNSKVALFLDNSPQCVESFLAITKLGAVAVLLDYSFSKNQISEILNSEKPDLVFVSDYELDLVLGTSESTILGIDDNRVFKQVTKQVSNTISKIAAVNENDNAIITYSSTENGSIEKHSMTQKAFIEMAGKIKNHRTQKNPVMPLVEILKSFIAPIFSGFAVNTTI